MNIEKIENLIKTNEEENITMAIGIVIAQVSPKNVFSTVIMLKYTLDTKFTTQELEVAINTATVKLSDACKRLYSKSIGEIFQLALSYAINSDDLSLAMDYYVKYVQDLTKTRSVLLILN